MSRVHAILVPLLVSASLATAQQIPPTARKAMDMGGGQMPGMMMHGGMSMAATQSGQAAFAAIADVVKILEADSTTDWSKVNLEALRQHLIDMDNVVMRAQVGQVPTAGGLVMTVTGTPVVAASIQRMVGMHATMLDSDTMAARATKIPGGMRLTVTARDTANTGLITRIRGLGFIGLLTVGEHHQMHHLMVARGEMMMGH